MKSLKIFPNLSVKTFSGNFPKLNLEAILDPFDEIKKNLIKIVRDIIQ